MLSVFFVYFNDYSDHSAQSSRIYHAVSLSLVLAGLGVRCYTVGTTPEGTSGRNTDEQVAERLNTTGIYSLVRHPLYLGNYLIWVGLVVFVESPVFILVFSLLYWIYYERIMLAEEAYIAGKFGDAFIQWSNRVPAFIPRFSGFERPVVHFSIKPALRGEYSGLIAIAVSYLFLEIIIGWVRFGRMAVGDRLLYICCAIVAVSLVLRTLKHHSRLLNRQYPS
ncbi:MAG: methyltransferase family protein [Bacteroidota bacterium]